MLRPIFVAISFITRRIGRFEPGVRLIIWVRRRDGLKWGIRQCSPRSPYYLPATLCQYLVEAGWTLWLSAPMLWCLIRGTTIIILGPPSGILLPGASVRGRNRSTPPANTTR